MQAYTEIVPPTGVTSAVKLPFLGSKAHNLVIAKTSLLQVFETRLIDIPTPDVKAGTGADVSSLTASQTHAETRLVEPQMKLVLIGEYQLSGVITSLAAIKTLNTKSGGHALLIALKDAKISLVEWDPEQYGLSTISIHFYENEDLQGSPWVPQLEKSPTILTVDPSSRCAALKFGQRSLAILPFRQSGDDLTLEDYDPELDGVRPQVQGQSNGKHGVVEAKQTPYASSFVLSLTALDPNLLHPIDIAFLYEYREPTLGVLSSARYPSTYLNPERKDALSYTVFTLDLDHRARTPLLSVSGLPYDLHKLVPLALPVGGTLLLGGNEIIHIDQSGKTNAVAVNQFAKQCSSFAMVDQTDLALKLEGCTVEQINRATGEMLIILATGDLVILAFRVDGRSVSGLTLSRVSNDHGGNVLAAAASCTVSVGNGSLFVGSKLADSVILRYRQKGSHLSRKRSHAEMLGIEDVDMEEEEEDDDDDLYGNDTAPGSQVTNTATANGSSDEMLFTVQDTLANLGSTGEPALGRSVKSHGSHHTNLEDLDIVMPVGAGKSGGLAFLSRGIQPNVLRNIGIDHATDVWAVSASKETPGNTAAPLINGTTAMHREHDQFMVTSGLRDEKETSTIYAITESGLEQRNDTDFETDASTINVGILCNGSRIVQVSIGEIRCYDPDLGLAQIIPMVDEATDTEMKILHSSFADPYLLVIRDDLSVAIFKTEKNGDIEEMDKEDTLAATKWISGCLYKPANSKSGVAAYLLSAVGGLYIFEMATMNKPVYVAENLRNLPYILTSTPSHRRGGTEDQLVEILACDLGDSTATSLHLIARTTGNEFYIYEPFHYPKISLNQAFTENLRWRKISLASTQQSTDGSIDTQRRPLRVVEVGGYRTVLCPAEVTFCILKEAASLPRLMRIRTENACAINSIHSETCQSGLVIIDSTGSINLCRFPSGSQYGQTGWEVQRLGLGEEVTGLVYHQETGLYVIAANSMSSFTLPEDDWHQEWAAEDLSFKPETCRGMMKLFDPKGRSVIHELSLEEDETILCVKSLNLEVSERTGERRTLIAVGTGLIRGEDVPSNGSIYIFDVITVVPDIERPETSRALKLIVREETKGAVTAISDIGIEGFLLHAQGQKCIVRGLKEDCSLLPVAFIDVQCCVCDLKSVKGTGLMLWADAVKGLCFGGFLTDPYALKLFGKSATDMEVVAADFLPWDKQLFMLVADTDCTLHVLEFNPENPKSMSGQRLIPKSSFHTGHFIGTMTLLPSTASTKSSAAQNGDVDMTDDSPSNPPPQILLTTSSGALVLVTQLDEQTYRRLGALQTYLTGILDHTCGLNPRAHRAVESEGFGGRGILDGQILTRWSELGNQRRSEACSRVGAEAWQLQADINYIGGGGLQYL